MNHDLLSALRRLHAASAAELPSLVVQVAADLTGAEATLLLLLTCSTDKARVVASRGLTQQQADSFSSPLDPELPARLRQHFGFPADETLMAAPLVAGDDRRGLLVARRPGPGQADVVLMALADHTALALEQTRRARRLAVAEQTAASASTEQRLLRALLQSLPAALWITDQEGRTTLSSGRAAELGANGTPWMKPGEHLPPESEPPLGRALRERVSEEEWLLGDAFDPVPLLCSGGPLRDESGKLLGAVLLGQDLRGRNAEEVTRRQHFAQEEVDQAKDLFFNALSHELRTPLAAILFALEVLQHPDASLEQRQRATRTIQRNVQHQVRLIDDLLDISRILRQRASIERRPVELGDLVANSVAGHQDLAHRCGLSLTLEGSPGSLPVLGDPARLEQVVSILVGNAIKFTEPGGTVTVQLGDEASWAVMRVRDTGTGIAAEVLPRLFQPLQQGDRSLSRSRGGLGAGLAIARWVVEQHGGHTAASSAGVNQGSEFVVRLPLSQQEAHRNPAGAAPVTAPPTGRRVLVVEDNHDLLDTLLALLEMLGHEVVPAADGVTALQAAQREHPQIAFIDIGLPDMDGYELARRLRADQGLQGMRLVALTGYASADHRERALRAGFDDYLAKPVDMETLELAVNGLGGPHPSL